MHPKCALFSVLYINRETDTTNHSSFHSQRINMLRFLCFSTVCALVAAQHNIPIYISAPINHAGKGGGPSVLNLFGAGGGAGAGGAGAGAGGAGGKNE